MKNFIFASLLLLVSLCAYSQKDISKSVVKNALRKMSGGRQLTAYQLAFTYDFPREVPKEMKQQAPMEDLMKSLMESMPDSMRTAMKIQIDSLIKQSYKDRVSMFAGWRETFVSDLANGKAVRIRTNPNSLTGTTDTSRTVYQGSSDSIAALSYHDVPIALLKYMASDSAQLHYTGRSSAGGDENHIVQVRIGGKWIDVYIGVSSLVVNRIVEKQVDTDPLIGRGPEHYKNTTLFSGYHEVDGFLFPAMQEEISSRGDFTIRKRLDWSQINKQVPVETFRAEPTYEERFRFKTVRLTDSLFVMLRSGNSFESRSLIRLTSENRMDCFIQPINHENVARRMVNALKAEFPGRTIRDVYCIENITTISALESFFELNASITAPKGLGIMAEEQQHIYNKTEDSTWKAKKAASLLFTFDKDFQKNAVVGYVLNPDVNQEWERFNICYYLPKERLIYYSGNPYFAHRAENKATIKEKWLYDFLVEKKMEVEKIIFFEAYVSGSPLEMSFPELERRVKSTDFSEYYKRRK